MIRMQRVAKTHIFIKKKEGVENSRIQKTRNSSCAIPPDNKAENKPLIHYLLSNRGVYLNGQLTRQR